MGYVEGAAGTWFFAIHLEIGLSSITGRREQLSREALRVKGIVEP